MKHSYIDKYSEIDSYVHNLDPRVKCISGVFFILAAIFTKPASFLSFALYALLIAILIYLSKIPINFILKKSLAIIPFVLMIAIFIPFFKEGKVAGAYSFGTFKLTVTYSGLSIFWNVLIKAYLSILCVITLMASTKFTDLLKALEKLKVPNIFIMIISFMYRYIFVIIDELMKMNQAREARSINTSKWFHVKTLANMLGVLFIRSYERAEVIYIAMCSRGFTGTINTLDTFQIKKRDFFFISALVGILILIKIGVH